MSGGVVGDLKIREGGTAEVMHSDKNDSGDMR